MSSGGGGVTWVTTLRNGRLSRSYDDVKNPIFSTQRAMLGQTCGRDAQGRTRRHDSQRNPRQTQSSHRHQRSTRGVSSRPIKINIRRPGSLPRGAGRAGGRRSLPPALHSDQKDRSRRPITNTVCEMACSRSRRETPSTPLPPLVKIRPVRSRPTVHAGFCTKQIHLSQDRHHLAHEAREDNKRTRRGRPARTHLQLFGGGGGGGGLYRSGNLRPGGPSI